MSSEPLSPDALTRIIVLPTPDEDAEITAAALSDPDAQPLTDEELSKFRPMMPSARTIHYDLRERHTLLLDARVMAAFRSTGAGWEERVNKALIDGAGAQGILPHEE